MTATSTIEIDAAILALQDSFYVNNWGGGGSYGTLNVFGSIAQNYRGPVGLVGGTGYTKNYNFDTSLGHSVSSLLHPSQRRDVVPDVL